MSSSRAVNDNFAPVSEYRSLESVVRLTEPRQKGPQGPDRIPGLVLKENADLLAPPTMDILNTSFRERRLP